MSDSTFPELLSELHNLNYFHEEQDGDVIDFEPYEEFQSADDRRHWFKAWTGNPAVDGAEFRVFGQDGSGGYAAFWLARPGEDLLAQPIVFFGSEGELGVVASDFSHYLWLLAGGVGPYEAIAYGAELGEPISEFIHFAEAHATCERMTPIDIVKKAQTEFPKFVGNIRALAP